MKYFSCRFLLIILPGVFLSVLSSAAAELPPPITASLVKLRVTYQRYDPSGPWKKEKAASRSGYACVLAGDRLLTTADIVKDSTLIKAEKKADWKYFPAEIEFIDYDLDLAVLAVEDPGFFDDLDPVELASPAKIDQPVRFLVFEDSKNIRAIPGKIVKVSVDSYYLGWEEYLFYGASVNFEDRGGGWSEPVFSRGELIGLTMSYNSSRQYAKIIPSLLIKHFLGSIGEDGYRGLPSPGFRGEGIQSPALREYLGLDPDQEGVYVQTVYPGGSADGVLRRGDVLLGIDGTAIDGEGYYDHPLWGKIGFSDLITRLYYPGDEAELSLLRDGLVLQKKLPLKRFRQKDYLIPVYNDGTPPDYLIVGGLVIQELSKDYLKRWGKNWSTAGNKKYLYYYWNYARRPSPDREKIVILNRVLPDEINVGYQMLEEDVIEEVNGKKISRIEDVAAALKEPLDGFHRIGFEDFDRKLILPADSLAAADRRIGEKYGIDRMRRIRKD